jgi:hypothetical protein
MKKYTKPQAIVLTSDLEVNILSDSIGSASQSTEDNSTSIPSAGIQLSKEFNFDLDENEDIDPWLIGETKY